MTSELTSTKPFFAISAYDKFAEVRVLVEILKENWQGDYGIVVYSSHPDASREFANLNIDALITTESYPYTPEDGDHILTARIFESMRLLFEKALELGADSITHLHSDSWPLSENAFLKVLSRLGPRSILARGAGLGERGFLTPLGVMSDMFLIFSAQWLRESSFLKVRASDLPLDVLNIHGLLSLLIFANGGFSVLDFYDNYQKQEILPDLPKKLPCQLPSYPSIFNRELGFLHVHTACFPDDLGKKLQGAYLKASGLVHGESLQKLTSSIDPEKTFQEIRERFAAAEQRLKAHHLSAAYFSQDLVTMEEYCRLSSFALYRKALAIAVMEKSKQLIEKRYLAKNEKGEAGRFRISRSLVFTESAGSYYGPLREKLVEKEAARKNEKFAQGEQ